MNKPSPGLEKLTLRARPVFPKQELEHFMERFLGGQVDRDNDGPALFIVPIR